MKVSILIPCHNEEQSIAKSVESCLRQSRPADEVIVVNDGSTDRTPEILATFGDRIRVLPLYPNTGNKSLAQERGLAMVTGDVVVTIDADSLLDYYFVEHIIQPFSNPRVAAVSGYVKSLKHNWLTACRQIEYSIGQDIYKPAQELIGHVLVMPGCASAFRTEVLMHRVTFDHDTITEDLDFTYQIHELGYDVAFRPEAIVYTQDPPNLPSYIRQTTRWYRGGWQNFRKHFALMWRKPSAAFEMSFLYLEGLISSFAFLLAVVAAPVFFLTSILPAIILLNLILGGYSAYRNRRPDILLYSPAFSLLMLLNSFLVLKEFVGVIFLRRGQLVWLKADRTRI